MMKNKEKLFTNKCNNKKVFEKCEVCNTITEARQVILTNRECPKKRCTMMGCHIHTLCYECF